MILIEALLGLLVLFKGYIAWDMWPPWRSENPVIAWLLFTWACSAAALEGVFLAATLQLWVPPLLALAILLGNNAVMAWWVVRIRRARNRPTEPEE